MAKTSAGGLAGVVVGESAVSTVDEETLGLTYRGYSITDLAQQASFEEVAYLMIDGKLPNTQELSVYKKTLAEKRALPKVLCSILEEIPADAHPMDVLRTGCSAMGTIEPERSFEQQTDIANRLLATMPGMLCYWYHYHANNDRIETGSDAESHAAHFLYLLHGKQQNDIYQEVVNLSFVLYAEHEFNASTFSARVTAATLSDFYSAVTSAIGTLRGPLHGGANEAAMDFIKRFKTPDEAESTLAEMFEKREKVMGFGHRVYKHGDPRAAISKAWAQKLAKLKGDHTLMPVAERIEDVMVKQKNIYPNVDFYSALVYHFCGIPTLMFTPLFAMARISGWAAHIFEQRADNRLIRPNSIYVGSVARAYTPLEER